MKVCALTVSSANGAASLTVLVVEDEFLVRDDIVKYLRKCGCIVFEADNAEQAIGVCHAGTDVDILLGTSKNSCFSRPVRI
jgi:DNA-binding NtrC family response regulator